jgi:hypothetical protein
MVTTNLTATPSPEAPGAGAVAHMSLHLKPTISKSRPTKVADNHCSPILLPGDLVSVYVGDRVVRGRLKRRSRPVRRHIWTVLDSVKPFFPKSFRECKIYRDYSVIMARLVQRQLLLPLFGARISRSNPLNRHRRSLARPESCFLYRPSL